jgi:cyclophilin family peptidyl-prolyl cis-trans isomerase
MPTEKRQRKRDGRQARLEAERAAARKAARRRQLVTAVVAAIVVLIALLFISTTGGDDDDDDVTADDTTTTTPVEEGDEDAEPTTTAPGEAAAFAFGTTACAPVEPPAEPLVAFTGAFQDCLEEGVDYAAEVVTDAGSFTIDLLEGEAPGATNNFVNLARSRFYDGATFHRVIEDFVIQGGDPVGDPAGTGGPGYAIPDELPEAGAYQIGSVAMANSGPDTAGSQFFVVTGEQGVALPPDYTLFGQVTEGMDVVEAIESNPGSPPEGATVIETVRIVEG